jgi:hypothetical protein
MPLLETEEAMVARADVLASRVGAVSRANALEQTGETAA